MKVKPKAAKQGAYDSYRCPDCKHPVHAIAKSCFKCKSEFEEPEHVRNVPMEADAVDKAIDGLIEVSELQKRGDYPWYAKVDPSVVALSKEARQLSDELRQSPGLGASPGSLRIDFHFNTIISRMVSDWAGYPKKPLTSDLISPEKLVAAYSLWKDAIADVVASLPDRNVRDAKSGKMVDPFIPLKKAFPGGTPQPDIAKAIEKAQNIFNGAWGEAAGFGANRNYLNALEILRSIGIRDDSVTTGIDKMHQKLYGQTTAELDKAQRQAMGELEIDVGVGDAEKQDFAGGTMYTKKPSVESAIDALVNEEEEVADPATPLKPIKYEGNIPPSFKRWAELNADKIEEINNEGGYDPEGPSNDYWLYLRPGWFSVGMGSHTLHEDTFREIRAMWKMGIIPCDCDSCKQEAELKGLTLPSKSESSACATCDGTGEIVDDDDYIAHTTRCPDCKNESVEFEGNIPDDVRKYISKNSDKVMGIKRTVGGYDIYTAPGFAAPDPFHDKSHLLRANLSLADVKDAVGYIEPCDCEYCQQALSEATDDSAEEPSKRKPLRRGKHPRHKHEWEVYTVGSRGDPHWSSHKCKICGNRGREGKHGIEKIIR